MLLAWCAVFASLPVFGCTDPAAPANPSVVEPDSVVEPAESDREALVRLYRTTGGERWRNNDGWLATEPLDTWHGVETDSTGRVVRLTLDRNDLAGPLPPELGSLAKLQSLDLSHNNLDGPLPPEYANLAELRTLRLRSNELTGPVPPALSRLAALQQLSLAYNRFSGPVPSELADFPDLKHLDLRHNDLSGAIPVELATLDSLEVLRLAGNSLTGPIPPELGRLRSLVQIRIADNELSGPLPRELSALSELEHLSVSSNRLQGTVPREYLGLERLRVFDWDRNDDLCLPGIETFYDWVEAIGSQRGLWCHESDAAALDSLYSSTGGPSWLSSQGWPEPSEDRPESSEGRSERGPLDARHGVAEIDSLGRVVAIDLTRNGLTGVVPMAVGRLGVLESLRVGGNSSLRGGLPKSMTDLDRLRELQYDGTELCVPDDPEVRGWLEGVSVHNGTGLRCEQLDDRALLANLYAATNGPSWTRRSYWLTDLPLSEWWGVETDGAGRVVGLDLSDNGLAGSLPLTLGYMRALRTLDLSRNDLAGPLPPEYAELAELRTLRLRNNALTGPVPPVLVSRLAALQQLSLAYNHFSGTVPPELGRLPDLMHLDLRRNDLSGAIPVELATLESLEVLRLAGNSLTGPIPPELGRLRSLVQIRIADNELSGPLPRELSALSELEQLSASNNRLQGTVPREYVGIERLRVFEWDRNDDLCLPGLSTYYDWAEAIERHNGPWCHDADVAALDSLYSSAGGRAWLSSEGWREQLEDPSELSEDRPKRGPLDARHGVAEIDSLGRVVAIDLTRNGLTGVVPMAVGRLGVLESLRVGGNSSLRGGLPKSMTDLDRLRELSYDGTELCVPDDPGVRSWLEGVSVHNGTGLECEQLDDRALLADLYAATDGPSWARSYHWLTDLPLAEWWGVETDSAGRVVGLDLAGNWLRGPLPPTLGRLQRLRTLRLSGNWLHGEVPSELGALSLLQRLELERNHLLGPLPPELGNLAQLRTLNLSYNDFDGPLPPEYADLVGLRTLHIRDNALTGPVPPVLSRLTALQLLSLAYNDFSGTIPVELADFPDLKYLDLSQNDLSGPIPVELATLGSLEVLRLAGNRLTGPIPRELGQLRRLVQIRIAENALSGALPPELSALSELEQLSVSNNRLQGTVPSEYRGLERMRVFDWRRNGDLCAPGTREVYDWVSTIEHPNGPWCHESDIAALDSLYSSTGGPSWLSSEGWPEPSEDRPESSEDRPEWGPLDPRHGVAEVDSFGRVVKIDLQRNGLTGVVPLAVGRLSAIESLSVGGNNALRGRLPKSMTNLDRLQELSYDGTALCVPDDPGVRDWLEGVSAHNGTGLRCEELDDRALLANLHAAANGRSWTRRDHWLTALPVGEWWGVETDGDGRVVGLDLSDNGLAGSLPPTLGHLQGLQTLRLSDNNLHGEVPPELGALSSLRQMDLERNALTGPVPPELGNLRQLQELLLSENILTDTIPLELASLAKLVRLRMFGNELTGPLPAELLSSAASLEELDLGGNDLSGPLQLEIVELDRLKRLRLAGNADLHGSLPEKMTSLGLEELQIGGTELCVPRSPAFQAWLNAIPNKYAPLCPRPAAVLSAYLVQAVQSRSRSVPLIAGREALLRVFVTSPLAAGPKQYPPVRANFFAGDREVYTVDIATQELRPTPEEVEENDLAASANAEVPGWVVQPGLEIVVETNPDGEPAARRRLPEAGRMALDVRQVPPLSLTIVPFLLQTDPDSSVLEATTGLAADSDLLWQVRTFSPTAEVEVEMHEPVWTPSDDPVDVVLHMEAIRLIEKKAPGHWGGGYWMGLMSVFDGWGTAIGVGRSSVASPVGRIMAHELLHNMGPLHAPCGYPRGWSLDYNHPHSDGKIGGVGYDFRSKELISSSAAFDVMASYIACRPMWVSDYTFVTALRHRLTHEAGSTEGSGAPAGAGFAAGEKPQALLLWGRIAVDGTPSLNPAFLVDAWPALPAGGGDHEIVGRDEAGRSLFSLRFDPREAADGDGSSVFAFTLPVRPEWADALARITYAGPGQASAALDDDGPPMALLRDPDTGQVRGILRAQPAAGSPSKVARLPGNWAERIDRRPGGLVEPGWRVQISRGVPDPTSWRR